MAVDTYETDTSKLGREVTLQSILAAIIAGAMSEMVQGVKSDGALSAGTKPVIIGGVDVGGVVRQAVSEADGRIRVSAPDLLAALVGFATEATLAAAKLALDAIALTLATQLDVPLSTRASEATLATRAAAAQLPALLVSGRLDENLGAWLGSTAPTVGQKPMVASIPVVMASDQSALPVDIAELPAAAPLADADPNPTTTRIGANALVFNGATWDRARGDIANGLDVDVTREPATAAEAAAAPAVVKVVAGLDGAAVRTMQMRTAAPAAADEGLVVRNIPSGTQTVSPAGAATSATANVAQNAAASVVLIAANATRRTAWIYNDPSNAGILFVKWGVAASSTSFTQALLRGESMFWDGEEYSGVVEGRWSLAGAGAARVTETTP